MFVSLWLIDIKLILLLFNWILSRLTGVLGLVVAVACYKGVLVGAASHYLQLGSWVTLMQVNLVLGLEHCVFAEFSFSLVDLKKVNSRFDVFLVYVNFLICFHNLGCCCQLLSWTSLPSDLHRSYKQQREVLVIYISNSPSCAVQHDVAVLLDWSGISE